jgi:hypothetical protein
MRSRLVTIGLLVLVAVAVFALPVEAHVVLAQQGGEDTQVEGQEGQDEGGGGQDDPEAETGASKGETEDASTEETGPPWTYQMAWITLALLVLLALGLASSYYRLVISRRRGEV